MRAWDGAGGIGVFLRILTKIRYLLDTFRALFSVLTPPELVDGASEWTFTVGMWRFGARKYALWATNYPGQTFTRTTATATLPSSSTPPLMTTKRAHQIPSEGATNVRCVAMRGAKSVFSVDGSGHWSPTAPTNTFCSTISSMATQQAGQSEHWQVYLVELDVDYCGAKACKAPLLLLDMWYTRSIVRAWDGAGGIGVFLRILTKKRISPLICSSRWRGITPCW